MTNFRTALADRCWRSLSALGLAAVMTAPFAELTPASLLGSLLAMIGLGTGFLVGRRQAQASRALCRRRPAATVNSTGIDLEVGTRGAILSPHPSSSC
jgi:hypothetical protein